MKAHPPHASLRYPQVIPEAWKALEGVVSLETDIDKAGAHDVTPSSVHLGVCLPALAYGACLATGEEQPPTVTFLAFSWWTKIYLLSFRSGLRLVARIPRESEQNGLPGGDRSGYLRQRMESEVATLCYLRCFKPEFPSPGVWAWNSDANNAAGVPYLLVDYLEGETLEVVWRDNVADRSRILDDLALHYSKLANPLPFSSFGMIKFRSQDTSAGSSSRRTYPELLQAEDFVIGPYLSEPQYSNAPRGEGAELPRYAASSVEQLWRDLWKTEAARTDWNDWKEDQEVTDEEVRRASTLVLELISSHRLPDELVKPCLVIGDFAWRNIICDPLTKRIVGFIDLQGMSVMPRFGLARYPEDISTYSATESWVTSTGGFRWVPPSSVDQATTIPIGGEMGLDGLAELREEVIDHLRFRQEFRLRLKKHHPNLNDKFWEASELPLKIMFLLVHGLPEWVTHITWLARELELAVPNQGSFIHVP
ncbi:hypothetical protein DACRYDRAFT_117343 [Dacryopinax primogenitus]|uniref:Uncharacterized protein n=1 Tax=Dacryopinax primogenitus (strain DJM 731) TaxID=1858805 RepID=M5G381_DACPD|nr:uncharacterized protein DACRYDRAFT_117343 [Dacryopinax primogenitus]EJU00332.1 hypothetical protein DACRYDRAFT_117343 [Dacryopinax primogenitus]